MTHFAKRVLRFVAHTIAAAAVAHAAAPAGEPAAPPPAGAQLDLLLLAGQSNMAGRGTLESQDGKPAPRTWTFTKTLEWAPAADPLHFDKPVAGVGPGRTFGMLIAGMRPDAQIGLIPCAVGGTSIERWKKAGSSTTTPSRAPAPP